MEAPAPKKPRAPRKKKEKEPEPETRVVPVGDSHTIEGLPTEVLDEIVSLLILIHPRHAFELGLASRFYHFQVRTNPGWKQIAETAGVKPLKASKAVPFPFLTAVSRSWTKICEGCHEVKKDKVPVEYTRDEPIMLCSVCRVARHDPSKDSDDLQPLRRISKQQSKELFKLTDHDLRTLTQPFYYDEVRALARKLHGGDKGIKAVVEFSKERLKQLRQSRSDKKAERERIVAENKVLRRAALTSRLKELGLEVPQTNSLFRNFVENYQQYTGGTARPFVAETDQTLSDTVRRLQQWDLGCKQRRRTLPDELKKHGLEYSDDSDWCKSYVEQNHYVPVTVEKVVKELSELKWFFEHTDYRKIRFGDRGQDRRYFNDYESDAYHHIERSGPRGLVSVYQAKHQILSVIIAKRFGDKKTLVSKEDEEFKNAPESIIARVNGLIQEKLNPPTYGYGGYGYGYRRFGVNFPFGIGGYDSEEDFDDSDEEGSDGCSIM